MRNTIIFSTLLLLLSACDSRVYPNKGWVCKSGENVCVRKEIVKIVCDIPEKAKFILDCAKAANPMSDEEGEDLVKQCEDTASHLYCKPQE